MTPPAHDAFAAFMGIDWADAKHDLCLPAPGTAKRECFQLEHTPEAIDAWVTTLRTRCNGPPVAVCLALDTGPMVSAWRKYDFLVLFPLNPLTLARSRDAFTPSRATDDPTDAALQLALLLTHRDKLTPLTPQRPTMRALAHLVEHRRRGVGDTVRSTHRLTRTLKHYFPHVLQWVQENETVIFCDFLRRWPTLKAVQLARRSTRALFFRDQHVRSPEGIARRIPALRAALPLPTADGVLAPHALLVQARVAQLRVTVPASADCAAALAQRAQRPPDFPLFQALPGRWSRLRFSSLGRLWGTPRTVHVRPRTAKICRDRARPRTQRQEVLGALASPGAKIPPATGRRVGGRVDPACLLGPGLLSAATRPGQHPSGGRAGPGVQRDPSSLSGLAGAHAVRCSRLSPGAQAPGLIADATACAGLLHNRQRLFVKWS
jgi:Transposase